tara:strand:+ start:19 stop:624 length:606 start_codon:yes stop_codon:yes gene_type:complete
MNKIFLILILSYLIGSISGSLLLGKIWNIDIRKHGSKSAGGTNALRTVGVAFALLTLVIDVAKGFIPTYLIGHYTYFYSNEMMLGAGAAILGHVYPLYYKFNGGKGAATVLGALFVLTPQSIPYILAVWVCSVLLSGYVGISTIFASLTLFIYTVMYLNIEFQIFGLIVFIFIVFTHRKNLSRMRNGTENRFTSVMIFKPK